MTTRALVLSLAVALPLRAAEPEVLPVWPGAAPGEVGAVGPETEQKPKAGEMPIKRITNVTKPTIHVYRPAKDKDTGVAVIVCPGGGYNILAWEHEGTQVAEWLNSLGVTGVILKYRVPRRSDTPAGTPPKQPLMDAQRAVSLVRSKSAEWGIDAKRIGLVGFSAGGHLTAAVSTNFDKRSYEPIDDVDRVSCRPDFAAMVYAGGLTKKDDPSRLSDEIRVSPETPPTFLAHSGDDRVPIENSVQYYLALRKAKVPTELHAYTGGGHGYGMRSGDKPCHAWMTRFAEWMRDQQLLPAAKGKSAGGT